MCSVNEGMSVLNSHTQLIQTALRCRRHDRRQFASERVCVCCVVPIDMNLCLALIIGHLALIICSTPPSIGPK